MTSNPAATASDYSGFRANIEGGPGMHNSVHCAIGGVMCTAAASNAPEFFLHHTFMDKIWANWQAQSPAHVTAYQGSLLGAMPGGGTPADVMDLNSQFNYATGETSRVCYITPSRFIWLEGLLKSLTMETLSTIPRTPVLASSVPWLQVMQKWMPEHVTNETIEAAVRRESVRNGSPAGRYSIISPQSATKCNCITANIGVGLADAIINPIPLVANGCTDENGGDESSATESTFAQPSICE